MGLKSPALALDDTALYNKTNFGYFSSMLLGRRDLSPPPLYSFSKNIIYAKSEGK